MRILLVSHYYSPEIGAPQRRWDALVERFVGAGHQVAVLAPSPHYPSGRSTSADPRLRPGAVARGHHGEIVHRLRYREYDRALGGRGRDQATAAVHAVRTGMGRFTRGHRPDVVVATVPGLPTLPAGLTIGAGLGVPVVVEMRDAWPDLLSARSQWDTTSRAGTSSPSRIATRALTSTVTALQRRAAAVVTTTDSFARVLRERLVRPVVTIRHGTGQPRATPRRADDDGRPLRVLYAGTVGRSQGLATAVRAAAECVRRGAPVELRIVGDGADRAPLRDLAASLGAPVVFHPAVPAAEVRAHYEWTDTVLVPLRNWGPLRWTVPSKIYDALASGRHITAAVSGEAEQIVHESAGGHVVPPDDAAALAGLWTRLSERPHLLEVGPQGRAWVARNADDDALAGRYLALLEEAS